VVLSFSTLNLCDVVVYPRWVINYWLYLNGLFHIFHITPFCPHHNAPFNLGLVMCFIFCVVMLVQGREVCRIQILVVDYKDFYWIIGSCEDVVLLHYGWLVIIPLNLRGGRCHGPYRLNVLYKE